MALCAITTRSRRLQLGVQKQSVLDIPDNSLFGTPLSVTLTIPSFIFPLLPYTVAIDVALFWEEQDTRACMDYIGTGLGICVDIGLSFILYVGRYHFATNFTNGSTVFTDPI